MTYTLISDIDELVSEKQQLSRGVNDNMPIPNIRDLIESSPASSMQFQRGSNRMMKQQQQSADFLMNQFPTKSLRRQQPQASMFEKTPIVEILKEEIPIIIEEKQTESSQKCNDIETMLKIEEMNTMFKHNINVINDNILLLYKKLHNQDMQLKGIMFILFIILILVIKK